MDADDPIRRESLQPEPSPTTVGRPLMNEQRWLPGERQTLGCIHHWRSQCHPTPN